MDQRAAGRFSRSLCVRSTLFQYLLLLIFFLQHPVSAQHITGDLQFRVVDSVGHPVSGANALVTGSQVQGVRGGVTDELGYFNILALPPGKVSIHVSHAAYQPVVYEDVLIQLGKTTSLGEIRVGPRIHDMPELLISGQRAGIDPGTTAYGSNLRSSDFENLPVERNYRNMTSLLPQSNISYFGDGVNIAGATGNENKYFVDGVEVTDPLIGGTGTNLPYNFIQEIEVKAGGYEAEFRSALGGLVNVVTYSGTNEFHGSAFGFSTSNRLTAYRRVGLLDPNQGGFSDYDVGLGIGGPIIRDELWFYAAYNPTFARRDVDVPGNGISVDRTLTHSFATKLTWSASQQLHLIFTSTGDPTEQKAVGFGIAVPPFSLTNPDPYFLDLRHGGFNVSLNGTYILGNNIVLGASLARVTRYDAGNPSTERGREEVLFNDMLNRVMSGGVGSSWDVLIHSNMLSLGGTLLVGAHTVTTGVEYKVKGVSNPYDYHNIIRYNESGYYESIGKGSGQEVSHRLPAIFLQDKWQMGQGLRVNAGIRWDGQFIVGSNGEVVQRVTVPLQPRLGFTYAPHGGGSQKIFGSFGRFSQELGMNLSVGYHSNDGYDYTVHYDHDPRVSRSGGDTTLYQPHAIYPEVEGLHGQFFDEFSLGYERSITGNIRVSMQGLFRTLREAIEDVFFAEENRFRFGNPGRGFLSAWPRPQRDYTSLIVSIERHGDERFNFLASYVLSRDYGNYEGLMDALTHGTFPNVNGTFDDLNAARLNATGLVPNDRTHVFKFSGSYRFPFGFSTGISFTAQSGTPLSEWAWNGTGKEFLITRGAAGRTAPIWDLNARCMYELPFTGLMRIKLILDAFHIASRREPVDIDKFNGYLPPGGPLYPNPTYGQPFRYQPPMSVRLGMEVSF